ncbi:YbaB/EbfC family nucleoid-associated protein [Micromonospora sp. NPDC047620]|uniref:YbaB/EbfC family nucleoid-associated protein n=1 Tax=Micromonospora sp. NPDC047620 TaxID=3364251 RepID=UPI003723EE97
MDVESLRRLCGDMVAAMTRAAEFAERAPHAEYEATSPDGEVTVRVSGAKELLEIWIDTRAKRTVDNLTLGELVTQTIRAAELRADDARAQLLDGTSIGGFAVGDVLRDPGHLLSRFQPGH